MRALPTLLLLLACTAPPQPVPRPMPKATAPNVVIVLVDTLRADALGTHGAPRLGVSPHVDDFAKQSLVFERAITPNAWTVPAVASLFTASWPQTHGVLRFRPYRAVELETLSETFVTLAEVFQANGWRTGALLKTGVITASHGFDQGFHDFDRLGGDVGSGQSAAQLTHGAVRWIDERSEPERPFLLYLHYMDPHTPYQPPPPLPDWARSSQSQLTGAHHEVAALDRGDRTATAADQEHLRALYDAEVQTFDRAFGELMDHLHHAELDRPTAVVLIADHGEQLGEHDGWLHSDLWPENILVPWMVRFPGLAPRRVGQAVSTVDLAPTLTTLAGLPAPRSWQGQSRLDARRGDGNSARPIFSEYAEQRTVWHADRALYLPSPDAAPMLFDPDRDPGFRRDLASTEPARVAELRALLDAHDQATRAARPAPGDRPAPDDEADLREALRELGYVE